MAAASPSFTCVTAPPRDAWDSAILALICAGLMLLLWLAVATPLSRSAIRASRIFREVLERWETQRFLGVPCTYGEDRALTT